MTDHPNDVFPPSPLRAWQRMLSGRRLDLLDPSPSDIEIEDIAHGLARLARWNGQTNGPHAFSVAQHVIVVEEIASALNPDWPSRWRLAALLHDAPEYVIGDLISPFKTAIGLDYKAFELKLLDAIHRRFDIPVPLPKNVAHEIKRADRIAAFYEATRLAGFALDEAHRFFGRPEPLAKPVIIELERLVAWSTDVAQCSFLEKYNKLLGTS
jgi:5'-deoxynucleotidase YfbR-like HD superfamily hydrolase